MDSNVIELNTGMVGYEKRHARIKSSGFNFKHFTLRWARSFTIDPKDKAVRPQYNSKLTVILASSEVFSELIPWNRLTWYNVKEEKGYSLSSEEEGRDT